MTDKLQQGEALFEEGKTAEAKECFTRILQQEPRCTEAYNNLGVIAFQSGEAEEAIRNFRAALEIDCMYKDAVTNLAAVFRSVNHVDAAISTLKEFDRRSPADEEITALLKAIDESRGKEDAQDEPTRLRRISSEVAEAAPGSKTHPEQSETPWNSLWTKVKVEDILKEPSHQEIADNVTGQVGVNGRRVLEVGCGTGGTGMSLAQYGANMTLFDMSPDSLELSRRVFHHQGLKGSFIQGNMLHLPFADNSFDIVVSFGVLEHFQAEEIVQALKEMKRVAGETIVTTVPNARCAFYRIAKWYAEKTGTWQYGYEKPEYSMRSYFQEAEIDLYKEYSIGFVDSVAFVGRLPNAGPLQQISLEFNREHPNVVDGSLIISFGNKNDGGQGSRRTAAAKLSDQSQREFSPLVTVLMCAWNAEKFIAESIQSILNQTYHNFEVIIVDDGSTDHTRQVVASFDDARIRYVHKDHSGLADSRNYARSQAKGDYSVIVDADDLIAPDLLEKEIQVFRENPGDCLVVYPYLELMEPDGQKTGTIWRYSDYRRAGILPGLFRAGKNIVPEASMMIPRRLWEQAGPYNTHLRDSDNEFIARLADYTERFVCLNKPLYFYRRHDGNMSAGSLIERASSSLAMMEKMLELYGPRELFPDLRWAGLDEKNEEALFHLAIAEVLWSHCRLYPKGGGFEQFLEKTILHLQKSRAADPANDRARSLAEEIAALSPEEATEPLIRFRRDLQPMRQAFHRDVSPGRQPLKILYLADSRSPHTKRYARFFKDRGHEVHVFDTSAHRDNLHGIPLHIPRSIDNNASTSSFGELFIHTVFELNALIDAIRPDILHGHYLSQWCWWGAFSGFQPYVTTAWGSDIFLDTRTEFNRRFTGFSLKESALVTADSMDLLNATGALRGNPDGLEYIPFGIDVEFFRPGYDVSELAARLGVSGKKVVLSPRQFKPPANIDIIIKAIPKVMANIPDATFILKTYLTDASSASAYEQSLRKLVQELNVQDRVIFLQDMDAAEIPVLYNLADVMVTLRDTDGSACSMLECMACKTPVVASNIESMREWIRDGENGRLVDQHSPDAVADAVIELLLDQEKKSRWIDAGYAQVQGKADYRKNWAEVEDHYYRLLARGRAGKSGQRIFSDVRVSRLNDTLNRAWTLIGSRSLDQGNALIRQILEIDKLPMHLYLKALLGAAKIEWMKQNFTSAKKLYWGCLNLLQQFDLGNHLDIKRQGTL